MRNSWMIVGLLGLLFVVNCPQPVDAQLASNKPITFVVGFAPGGAADIIARLIADKLGQALGGMTVVVENRAGASSNVAARFVAGSEANGHTILITTTSVAVNETLYKNKGYSAHDLRAVSIAAATPESLVINPTNPAKTLQEFIANAKKKSISFGSAGAGTSSFISAYYFFKTLAKIDAVHVPFQGGAPALTSLMGGTLMLLASPCRQSSRMSLRDGCAASRSRAPPVFRRCPMWLPTRRGDIRDSQRSPGWASSCQRRPMTKLPKG